MSEQTAALDPAVIYFTFSHIRPKFSCGRTIEETYQQILKGEINYETDLPTILVHVDKEGNYFSMNNRRLFLYKRLREAGELYTSPSNKNKKNHNNGPENTIQVRLKPLPNTKRMKDKYSKEKCALNATLKREKGLHPSKEEEEEERSGSESDDDDDNDHSNNNNNNSLQDDIHDVDEAKEKAKQKRNKKNKNKNEMDKKDEDEKNNVSNNNKNNNNLSSTQQKKLKRIEKKKAKSNNTKDTKTLEDELNDLLGEDDSD